MSGGICMRAHDDTIAAATHILHERCRGCVFFSIQFNIDGMGFITGCYCCTFVRLRRTIEKWYHPVAVVVVANSQHWVAQQQQQQLHHQREEWLPGDQC